MGSSSRKARPKGEGGGEAISPPSSPRAAGARKARAMTEGDGQGSTEPAHPQLFYCVERFRLLVLDAAPLPSPSSSRDTLLAYLNQYLNEGGAPRPEEGEAWEESMAKLIAYFSGEDFHGGDAQACFSAPDVGEAKMNSAELHSRDIYPEAWAAPFEQTAVRKAQQGAKEGKRGVSTADEKVQQLVERAAGSPRPIKFGRAAKPQATSRSARSPRAASSPRAEPSSPASRAGATRQQQQEEEAQKEGTAAAPRSACLTPTIVLQYRLLMHLATSTAAVELDELEDRMIGDGPAVKAALMALTTAGQVKRVPSPEGPKYEATLAGKAALPNCREALLEHAKEERSSEVVEEDLKYVGQRCKSKFVDGKWYEGLIADYDGWNHLVNYDDGDQRWEGLLKNIEERDCVLLQRPGSGGSSKSGSGGKQAGGKRKQAGSDSSAAVAQKGTAAQAGGPYSDSFDLRDGESPKRRKSASPAQAKQPAVSKRGARAGTEVEVAAQPARGRGRKQPAAPKNTIVSTWVKGVMRPKGDQAVEAAEQLALGKQAAEGGRRAGGPGSPRGSQQVGVLAPGRVSTRRQSSQSEEQQQQQQQQAEWQAAAAARDQDAGPAAMEAEGGELPAPAPGQEGTAATCRAVTAVGGRQRGDFSSKRSAAADARRPAAPPSRRVSAHPAEPSGSGEPAAQMPMGAGAVEPERRAAAAGTAAATPAHQLASNAAAINGRSQARAKPGGRVHEEREAAGLPGVAAPGRDAAAAVAVADGRGSRAERPLPLHAAAVQEPVQWPGRQRGGGKAPSEPPAATAPEVGSSRAAGSRQPQGGRDAAEPPSAMAAGAGKGGAVEVQAPARRRAAEEAMQKLVDGRGESDDETREQAAGRAAADAVQPLQQPRSRGRAQQGLGGARAARPPSRVGAATPAAEWPRREAQAPAAALTKADCYWWSRTGIQTDRPPRRKEGEEPVHRPGYKSCHDCQEQHYTWPCQTGVKCDKSICVNCTRKYDYLFEPGHKEDLRKFCDGWCPDCIGICNRVGCLRKSLKSMGQAPPEVPASRDQKLVQALHLAFQLIGPARQMLAENEAQAQRQGMRLEDVPRLELDQEERLLCNVCATTIENAHYHCACDADLCLKCAAEFRPGDGPVECLTCHKPMELGQIFDPEKIQLLAGAEQRLQQIYEHGPLSGWLQELYEPRKRLWTADGEPIAEALAIVGEEEREEPSGRQPAPGKRGQKRKQAAGGAGTGVAGPNVPGTAPANGVGEAGPSGAPAERGNAVVAAPAAEAGLPQAGAGREPSPQAPGHTHQPNGHVGGAGSSTGAGDSSSTGEDSGSGKRQRKLTERAAASKQQEAIMQQRGIGGLLAAEAAQAAEVQANGVLPKRAPHDVKVLPSEFLDRTAFQLPDDRSLTMRIWWELPRNKPLAKPEDLRLAAQRPDGVQNVIWTPHVSVFAKDSPLRTEAMRLFMERWQLGEPIVVRGFVGRLDWSPDTMERVTRKMAQNPNMRSLHLKVLDCSMFGETTVSCKDFFTLYKDCHGQEVDEHGKPLTMYKLKDWPIDASFVEKMARHNDDFIDMLNSCMPAYTHPTDRNTGVLNLANHLPNYARRPDLGPKGYIAYGREKEHAGEGDSVTKLHEDLSEAINIMCHTQLPPGTEPKPRHGKDELWDPKRYGYAGAVWDIFRRGDRGRLKEFLADCLKGKHPELPAFVHQGERLTEGHPLAYHPIHAQCFFLTEAHRRVLAQQYGVHPWHLEQHCWEGVFVPGGTPHQVRNLRSSIKVALDFVTPEALPECVRLKAEFRELVLADVAQGNTYKDPAEYHYADRLQVRNMVTEGLAWALRTLEENERRVQQIEERMQNGCAAQ